MAQRLAAAVLAAALGLLFLLFCGSSAASLPPPATTRASQERGRGQTYGVGAHGQVRAGAWRPAEKKAAISSAHEMA
jgi:hypothetical protein